MFTNMYIYLTCLIYSLLKAEYLYEEGLTAAGTEFVVGFFSSSECQYPPMIHLVTPLKNNVEVNITTPLWEDIQSVNMQYHVNNSEDVVVELPVSLCVQTSNVHCTTVVVTSSCVIYLYACNLQKNSGDCYIIYPTRSFGREYVALGYPADRPKYKSMIGLVALCDDTMVNISVPANQTFVFENTDYINETIIQISLNMFELVRVDGADVTGSIITSNNPVGVFSGNDYVRVPGNETDENGRDLIMAHLPKSSTFGKIFPIVSSVFNIIEWVRVVALYDETEFRLVHFNNTDEKIFLHSKGTVYEFSIPQLSAVTIISTKCVTIAQYSGSETQKGDPRMFLPLSLENYVSEYMLKTPEAGYSGLFRHYIVVIANEKLFDRIWINDELLIDKAEDEPISQGYHNLAFVWIKVGPGQYHVTCPTAVDGFCTVYLHGYIGNCQYGTETNRYLGSEDTRKTTELRIIKGIEKMIQTTYKKAIANKKPLMTPQVTIHTMSIVHCHTLCGQYQNCAVTVFYKINSKCDMYTMYAASDYLHSAIDVVMFIKM